MTDWKNPEEVKEYYKKYREEHKEVIREQGRNWEIHKEAII